MGSLAVSRLAVDDVLPSASIADQVATIARKNLAPMADAIDAGTVYPDELLRRLGDAGAWGSHQPNNGAADLRCAIPGLVAAPGPDIAEAPQQFVRIDRALVDRDGHGCEVFTRDGRNLLGDRCRCKIVVGQLPR